MPSVEEEKFEDVTEVDEEVVTEEVMPCVEEEKFEDVTEVDEEVVTEVRAMETCIWKITLKGNNIFGHATDQ